MIFRIQRSEQDNLTFLLYQSLQVDGKTVPQQYYTKEAGSIIITLKPEFLETLSAGKHTLKAIFADGEVSMTFKVQAKGSGANPATGDESSLALWSALCLTAGLSAAACGLGARKRNESR